MGRFLVPVGDIPGRDRPDGSIPPTERVVAGTELVETDRLGAWVQVVDPDGRQIWVDGRRLVPVPGAQSPVASPKAGVMEAVSPLQPAASEPVAQQVAAPPRRQLLLLAAIVTLVVAGIVGLALTGGDSAPEALATATSSPSSTTGVSSPPTTSVVSATTSPPVVESTSTVPAPEPFGFATPEQAAYEAFGLGDATIRSCNNTGGQDLGDPCHISRLIFDTGETASQEVVTFKPQSYAHLDTYWVLVEELSDGTYSVVETVLMEGEFEFPNSPWLP